MPGDLAGHRFTKPEGLVQFVSLLFINSTNLAQMTGGFRKTEPGQSRGISGFKMVWFDFFVLWHINLRGLFNAEAILLGEQ